MPKQDTLPPKVKKYLFDQHNFDEDIEDEPEEDLPPPPPTFSEEELALAKEQAFEKGKTEGLAQAAASREQAVAALLDTLTAEVSTLQQAEEKRAVLYETESVALARTIFETLFPLLNEKAGLNEVTALICDTLQIQRKQTDILVSVHPDYKEDVEKALSALPETASLKVSGDNSLDTSSCRVLWDNGGAERDITVLIEKISAHFDQALADRHRLRNNEEENSGAENSQTNDKTPQAPNGDKP